MSVVEDVVYPKVSGRTDFVSIVDVVYLKVSGRTDRHECNEMSLTGATAY